MAEFDTFLNKAKDKAKDVADIAGKKTGEFVSISKLKLQELQINRKISSLYEQLGRATYQLHKNSYENEELISSLEQEIDEQLEALAEVDEKLCDMKNLVNCPCCHAKNSRDAVYCSKCGNQLQEEFADFAEVVEEEAPAEDAEEATEE